MTTLLDEPAVSARPSTSAAQQLRTTTAAIRLAFTWFGVRKTLTHEQKAQAAEPFDAQEDFLSAGKKLIDTKHPAFRAVTAARNRIVAYWKGISLPFPEPGIRLIRQNDIAAVNTQLTTLRADLDEAVDQFRQQYDELRSAAQDRLGRLYNPADYPASLSGLFSVGWDFPAVEPPDYLQQLSPQLYQQEARRAAARFEEAIQLAEQAFIDELGRLVEHLVERLSGTDDGKPKVFRDSAIENLSQFFDRFRHLNVRSNEQLDELVNQAQQAVRGVRPQALRDDLPLRQQVATQLAVVQSALDGLLVERPRRAILRRSREAS